MKTPDIIKFNEFLPYFLISGTATIIDWTIFWVCTSLLGLHYEAALVLAYTTAGIFHYISNKIITFKCQSKQIGSQYSLYIVVATFSLLISMGIIALIVSLLQLDNMLARIITTLIMLVPNYILHKHITFNKKIFIQPEAQN